MRGMRINDRIRMATFLQNAGLGSVFVFMPVIARDVSASILETGVIIASFSLAQILSELYFGRASDRRGGRLPFIRGGFAACSVAFGLHYLAGDPAVLLGARIAAGAAYGIMAPAILAYAYEAGAEKRKVASVVSFHALGWLAGIMAAGLTNDTHLIFLVSSGMFAAGLAVSMRLPAAEVAREGGRGAMRRIISENRYLFLSLLMRHVGAASVWTVLPLMITEQLGGQLHHISIVYISNTATAFAVMTLMASRIRIPHIAKFKIGVGLTTLVFVGLLFAREWWHAMPFMALVGATWAFLYIGGNFHLMERNPKSTSTGVFSSTISIATVAGPLAAGLIASAHGYGAVLYFAIAVIVAAFGVSLLAPYRRAGWPGAGRGAARGGGSGGGA
ncbi:MAG: MFS transporter [Nitrosopumilus sp.]|nr:MFS transporter [Nitrosopumilus sp.]MDA7945318.1 MFS transporter [Nitrosopumilus sp.]MDA7955294.1 MFS transporter [Nitrosopumilus sp.]MDA7974228.1 MFS transporter [Nitrosopumilus sp.]